MEYEEGQVAEDGAGNFLVFKYGSWHPSNENGVPRGPIDASAVWGPGARELPNGTVERVGPQGGVRVVANNAQTTEGGVGKLTEAQGKAMLYGGMMRGAERDYQQAREEGYDPGNLRNQIANVAGVIPFDGDFFGRLIRDDVSDRGRQAELRWAEGNLRQLTGAAATNPEIARVAAINFDRGNDELAAQRYRTRSETYQGTRYAAGPGASQLGDYPGMGGAVGEIGENGLPTYPGVQEAAAGIVDSAPQGPRPGDVQVTQQPLAPEDTPNSLSARGYVYDPARDIWTRSTQVELPEGRAGGNIAPPAPGEIADDRRNDRSAMRQVDAGVRGVADVLTFGLADEIAAGANTLLPLDRGSRSGFTDGFGEAYRNNLDVQRGIDRADEETAGAARLAGQVAGGVVAVPRLAAQGGARIAAATGRQAVRAATRRAAARGAGEGAAFGGAYGFGSAEGSAVERAPNAVVGAAVGAPVGLAAPYVGNALGQRVITPVVDAVAGSGRFVGRQAGRMGNALGVPGSERLVEASAPNALRSGLNRLADRAPQNPTALTANASRYRAEAMEPTGVDVVDDGARGLMRALATRQTPARQAAREFATDRAEGLQDRIATQARRTISDDPRTPMEIRDQAVEEGRRRAAPLYDQAYSEPIEVTDEIRALLQTPAGKSAMQRAQRIAANERRQINLEQPDLQTLDYVKRGLDDVLDTYRDRTTGRLVLDTEGRAVQNVLANFRKELDRLSPTYGQARATYADSARLQNAAELGEQFMRMEADQFAAAVARLSPQEQEVARAAARRAVERAAGTQGQAPGVAQRLSGGREQGIRSQALLDDPEPMQRAMRTELEGLRNAQAVSPMQGSPTSMNIQDAGNAGGIIDAFTNPVRAAGVAIINRVRSRGFNDQEAQAIVEAAIDPNRTQEVIDILSQRMSRREARNLSRVIRRQVTIGLQSNQQQ